MTESYDDILNRTWEELPEEKVLPDGWFILRGRSAIYMPPKGDVSARVLIFYTVQEALEDVDQNAMDALGPDYDITQNEVVKQFWVERNRDWRAVLSHLKMLGVDTEGKPILDTLKSVAGHQIAARLESETFDNAAGETQERNVPKEFATLS